jgi:hypothetical protein
MCGQVFQLQTLAGAALSKHAVILSEARSAQSKDLRLPSSVIPGGNLLFLLRVYPAENGAEGAVAAPQVPKFP